MGRWYSTAARPGLRRRPPNHHRPPPPTPHHSLSLPTLPTLPADRLATLAEMASSTAPAHTPPARLALETTLLLHGVPRADAPALHQRLARTARAHGAIPALCGVIDGRASAELSDDQLARLLALPAVPKVNTATLGLTAHRGGHGATTVSATAEIAAAAGIRVFSTGGLGGVHRGLAERPDISADLAALARFPVAVVTSGCKSILDVAATREMLEALGVPVVGWRTDEFPAFYQRTSGQRLPVDARFDDPADLAAFIDGQLNNSGRGVVVANPIPPEHEIDAGRWAAWLARAEEEARAAGATGREVTPAVLAGVHRVSGGVTLRANIELVDSNVALGATLARALADRAAARPEGARS